MSGEIEEKLGTPSPETPGRARQTLLQLRCSWGRLETFGDDETPDVIHRHSMGDRQVWKRISGKGNLAQYELQRDG